MKNTEIQEEEEKNQILKGLEKVYEKLIEFKKFKKKSRVKLKNFKK